MKEFNENGDALLNILQESADGSTEVPMLSLLNRTTMDVIGKVSNLNRRNQIGDIYYKYIIKLLYFMPCYNNYAD